MFLNVIIVEKEKKNSEVKVSEKPLKMQVVEVSMQEIWQQTMPKIHQSKKTYKRKNKHKNQKID